MPLPVSPTHLWPSLLFTHPPCSMTFVPLLHLSLFGEIDGGEIRQLTACSWLCLANNMWDRLNSGGGSGPRQGVEWGMLNFFSALICHSFARTWKRLDRKRTYFLRNLAFDWKRKKCSTVFFQSGNVLLNINGHLYRSSALEKTPICYCVLSWPCYIMDHIM